MSYHYANERDKLFTDRGQRDFLKFRDHARWLLKTAGAVRMEMLMLPPGVGAMDSWFALACADRLVELKEVREITGPDVMGQDRVFVAEERGDGR
jgi:hypothetical protein